jgi:bifunctional non-homologous end joining protein LigD
MNAPHFVPLMKARPAAALPKEPGWLFEIKFDGIRAITLKEDGDVRLFSRKPRELTQEYPDIVEALRQIRSGNVALDGEIVALDDHGQSSFQLLQNRARDESVRSRICYYLFDLLQLEGQDLTPWPLGRRKELLQTLLPKRSDKLRLSPALEGSPDRIWKKVRQLGLEGIMAKREDSKYESDRRSGAWLKIKAGGEQEFVIGGYTPPKGSRQFFGALLIGYYKKGRLTFASKVGTGFDDHTLGSLYEMFRKRKTNRCPFEAGISGELPGPELRRCCWLRPQLVCQIKFAEWTQDGKLRQPVFLGLRDDKNPKDVAQELPD